MLPFVKSLLNPPNLLPTESIMTQASDIPDFDDLSDEAKKALSDLQAQEHPPEPASPPKPKNYTISKPFSFPLEDEFDYGGTETAFMPSATVAEISEKIKDLPKTQIASTRAGKEWIGVVSSGLESNVYASGLVDTAMREDANYLQEIPSEVGPLAASIPKYKVNDGVKFTGEKARMRVRQQQRLGATFSIPLWHSGFWIRIKAPNEGELLELYRQITADKITLGRATYGLLFSNNTSYATRTLLDFCVDHLYDTSLDIKEDDDIRDHIKTLDLQVVFWGLANAIWPNGFQYMRSCIADPDKCNHVIKERLDLSLLQMTDETQLTARQRSHMTRRSPRSMTIESLKLYHDEFLRGRPKKVQISKDLHMTFKVPTASQHIQSGHNWINAIEENYGRALIQDESRRDKYLIDQGKATVMRQYAHFIESIDVQGDLYEDTETIEDLLSDLTASDKIRDTFLKEVAKYIDASTFSFIAIPTFICPSCGGEQKPNRASTKHPDLIPLDVNNIFFALVVQRIRKIEAR
jgi:hypothetical protein